jgi:hypothetical protein
MAVSTTQNAPSLHQYPLVAADEPGTLSRTFITDTW